MRNSKFMLIMGRGGIGFGKIIWLTIYSRYDKIKMFVESVFDEIKVPSSHS